MLMKVRGGVSWPRRLIRWLGPRRTATAVFLAVLLFGSLALKDTNEGSGQAAQAGSCAWHGQSYELSSGKIPATLARVTFGATICQESGRITGVSPMFSGGTAGVGTPAGINFTNRGVYVVDSNATHVHVRATSTVQMCLVRYIPICGLTDTETYDLYFTSIYGPYPPGFIANAMLTSSSTRFMNGDSAPQIGFRKV